MSPTDPPPHSSAARADDPQRGAAGPDESLDALREQIRHAQETAERRVAEATGAARSASGRPPSSGYEVPREGGEDGFRAEREIQALAALLEMIRSLVPRELRDEVIELVRELLLLVRALLDWYIDRIERRR